MARSSIWYGPMALVVRLRWAVLIASLAVTGWLAPGVLDVRFNTDSEGSVPKGDPNQAYFEEVLSDFGNDQVGMVVLATNDELGIFAPRTLEKIEQLSADLSALDGVGDVVSLMNSRFLSGFGGDELTNDLIIGEIPADAEAARALRDEVLANQLFHRTLVSPDGKAAAINVFLDDQPDHVLMASGIDDEIVALVDAAADPEESYYASFIHTRMTMNRLMKADLGRLIPASFAVILLILWIALRSASAMVLPAMTIVMALIWTFGGVGRLGATISLPATMVPPLLIAIGCSLSLHVLTALRTRRSAGDELVDTFAHLAAPLITAGLTTAIGFGSLLISDVPNTQLVGAIAVAGILSTLWINFTFVPALLAIVPALRPRPTHDAPATVIQRIVDAVIEFNLRHHRQTLVVTAVLLVIAGIGVTRIQVDTDFLSYFREGSEIRVAADAIGDRLAGISTFYVVVTADESDAMREKPVLDGIAALQRHMEAMPSVDKASSFVNMVQIWHQAMSGDDPDSLTVPGSQEEVDTAVFLTVDQEEPAVRARYVVGDYSSMSIFVRSQLVSTTQLADSIREIEAVGRELLPEGVEVKATGTVVVFAKMVQAIVDGQRDSLGLALFLVFLVMAILFRSLRVGLISMISNVVPIFIVFGIMGWLGISLNLGTSLVASISLGIAVDDTIHYLMHYRGAVAAGADRREAMRVALQHVARPVIFTSIALALGFSVLLTSNFGMLASIGMLAGMTMLICLVSDLILTSALLMTFDFTRSVRPIVTDEPSLTSERTP